MAKRKFQLNDKVKVIKTGKIGVIGLVWGYPRVKYYVHCGKNTDCFYSYELEKIEQENHHNIEKKKTYPIQFCEFREQDIKESAQNEKVNSVHDLSFEDAKKLFAFGGEARTIALKSYTEKELTNCGQPTSWEEYVHNFRKIHPSNQDCEIISIGGFPKDTKLNYSYKLIAFSKLLLLRDAWLNSTKEKFAEDAFYIKHIEYASENCNFIVDAYMHCHGIRHFLAFPTREMAMDFLKNFNNLLEEAKDLI